MASVAPPPADVPPIQETKMLVTRETEVDPICPHCEVTLQEIWYRKLTTTLGVRFVYLCASCRKVLGVSHRKGFWMG